MTNRISASAASLATQNGVGSASYSAVNGASIAGEQESGAGRASSPLPAADTAWGELVKGAVKLLACTGSGIVFGFAVEKSKVYIPSVIQDQMLFTRFSMLKVFLSAVAAGLACFAALSLFPPTQKLFTVIRENYAGCVNKKRVGVFALGGIVLGMGMTISGACPGMVTLQIGAGTQNSLYTLAGCFIGALLYGAMEPGFSGVLLHRKELHSVWLDKLLHVPYVVLTILLMGFLSAVVLATEYFVPWQSEVPNLSLQWSIHDLYHIFTLVSSSGVGLMSQVSWSPILAGLLMGSLQLPVALSVEDSLGGSSSYCTLISHGMGRSPARQLLPHYFKKFTSGIGNWWQVVFWVGGACGAALSAYLSGTWGASGGVAPVTSVLGGVFMLFGARLASGCTSGHGLSGLALLSFPSFVAVPMIFAGGIGLAFAAELM